MYLGVTLFGHTLAILQYASKQQFLPEQTSTEAKATVSANIGTLFLEMTHPQFRKFLQDWVVYKQQTHPQPAQFMAHLYNACNEEVQISLINVHPDFLSLNE